MTGTDAWYASPTLQDQNKILRFERIALGPKEVLAMLRDAEGIANTRTRQPAPAARKLIIFVDEPAKLFADETYGLLLRARAQSLSRAANRDNGVRVELQW
jgi:hypothetical protein